MSFGSLPSYTPLTIPGPYHSDAYFSDILSNPAMWITTVVMIVSVYIIWVYLLNSKGDKSPDGMFINGWSFVSSLICGSLSLLVFFALVEGAQRNAHELSVEQYRTLMDYTKEDPALQADVGYKLKKDGYILLKYFYEVSKTRAEVDIKNVREAALKSVIGNYTDGIK